MKCLAGCHFASTRESTGTQRPESDPGRAVHIFKGVGSIEDCAFTDAGEILIDEDDADYIEPEPAIVALVRSPDANDNTNVAVQARGLLFTDSEVLHGRDSTDNILPLGDAPPAVLEVTSHPDFVALRAVRHPHVVTAP